MRDVRNNKQRITQQLQETTDTLDPGRAPSSPPHSTYSTGHAICTAPPPITLANYSTRRSSPILYVDTSLARHLTVTTDDLHEPFGSLMHVIRATDIGKQPQDPLDATHGWQDDAQLHLLILWRSS
jgi:hypothetical protein